MFEIDALRHAIEGRNARALSDLYADDATLIVMDRDNSPSAPRTISGREAIMTYYEDVCGREMTHQVVAGLSDDAHLAFTEVCAYPDGTKVFCSAMAELTDGCIKRQTNVQVWDT
jgi:ketosteroid isomerase-like protein